MRNLFLFFGLLLAYTLLYAGASHFATSSAPWFVAPI